MDSKTGKLREEHAELRRRLKDLESLIGRVGGVGWDDRSTCDAAALVSASEGLKKYLRAHELGEEALLRRGAERGAPAELRQWIEKNHDLLDDLAALLAAVAGRCDGDHVYGLRTVLERVRGELESHMDYEERVIFPLLEGAPR